MPNITCQIPDTYDAITRPITVGVVRSLTALMGLPDSLAMEYFGAAESQAQPGSTLTPSPQENKFPFTGKITIECTESYLEDRLQGAVKQLDQTLYFNDPALQVHIRPVYVGTEITLSFRYRAESRMEAERWRDEFRKRTAEGRTLLLHELSYHHGVPPAYLVILSEIYRLREKVAPYGQTLQEWFRSCITDKVTTLTTQAGTEPIMVIGETQVGVQGAFEFVAQPEQGSKFEELAAWETGFDYRFQFDKVISAVMDYPLVIHNQIIGVKYRPTVPLYELANRARYPNRSRFLLDQYTPLYPATTDRLSGVRVPQFDDWLPRYVAPYTSSIYTALIGLDLTDPQDVISFLQLGDYTLDPAVQEFLRGELPWLHLWGQSIFHMSLFRWGFPLEDGTITADAAFAVRAQYALNPRDHHHFRWAMINDLTVLSPAALERLRNAAPAALKILVGLLPSLYDALDPEGVNRTIVPKILGGRVLPKATLTHISDLINGTRTQKSTISSIERHMYTVGAMLIIAHKDQPDAHS